MVKLKLYHFKEDVQAKLQELGLSEVEGIRAAKAGRIQDKDLATELLKKDERDIGHKWKGHPRANQKRQFDYENDAARVVDLIGGTITIPQTGSYKEAIDSIKRNLPSGASVDKVKKFNMKPTDKGYQDIKVSVRFPNGGIGEIIIAEDIMADAKENRGGHTCYEIRRQLEKTDEYYTDLEVAKCAAYLKSLECAIYDRAGFDAEEFAKLKAMASDSVARLLGNAAISSSGVMKSVKSLSSKLHLCAPYSSNFQATPALSQIANGISETSDSGDNSVSPSISSITENEKNRHYQTEEDEMAQILAYLQNLGSQRDVAEDVLQKAKETGEIYNGMRIAHRQTCSFDRYSDKIKSEPTFCSSVALLIIWEFTGTC